MSFTDIRKAIIVDSNLFGRGSFDLLASQDLPSALCWAGYFLLPGQEKVTKEKATRRFGRYATTLRFSKKPACAKLTAARLRQLRA